MYNKQKGFSHFIIPICLLLIVVACTVVFMRVRQESPLAAVVTDLKSSQCKDLAVKLLQAEKAANPLHRCEQEKFKVADSDKFITRIYAVAGEVEERWEFECGYMHPECATYSGWFDEQGKLFDFAEPPDVANHDPSVYTLGCGQPNSSSVYDVEVKPALVYERNSYWWKIVYDKTPTNMEVETCNVSGTSLVRHKEALSSVKAEYLFNTDNCSTSNPSPCQSAKALLTKSIDACLYSQQELRGSQPKYDYDCTKNYIAQTGDTSQCGKEVNYGIIDCDLLVVFIKPL